MTCFSFNATAADQPIYQHYRADIMGTRFDLELKTSPEQGKIIFNEIQAQLTSLEEQLSPWIEESDLWIINRSYPNEVKVAEITYRLIQQSHQISQLTAGAFDISFASVGNLYNYKQGVAPDPLTLNEWRKGVNFNYVELLPNRGIKLAHPKTRIDLGGIAKGAALDLSVALLKDRNINSAYISLGGDSYVLGVKTKIQSGRESNYPWMLGIRDPRNEQKVVVRIPVQNEAVSTSGDYQRFFIDAESGQRNHHILFPDKGISVDHLMSVSVFGAQGWKADALSTAVFVMGATKGLQLINDIQGYDAVLVSPDGKVMVSDGLKRVQ